MPLTLVVVKWLCREESIVFIQGGEFHILTKLTLYREQLSRPCKYQKRFNETMRDDSFQSTYYLWRGHSGKAARHPSALLLVARKSWAIIGIFWSELCFWAQAFLTTPSSLCHPPIAHTDTDTYIHTDAHLHTQLHMNTQIQTHTCTLCHPAQWLGALAKFLNPPPAFWVGGSRLPENNGMD